MFKNVFLPEFVEYKSRISQETRLRAIREVGARFEEFKIIDLSRLLGGVARSDLQLALVIPEGEGFYQRERDLVARCKQVWGENRVREDPGGSMFWPRYRWMVRSVREVSMDIWGLGESWESVFKKSRKLMKNRSEEWEIIRMEMVRDWDGFLGGLVTLAIKVENLKDVR